MSAKQSTVIYKEIPGFPGYRIGDDGSVWSRRKVGGRNASVLVEEWRRRRTGLHKFGYPCITLQGRLGAKPRRFSIHRLLLTLFVGPCPEGMGCRHLDGNPANNAVANLCWGTQQENMDDKTKHGTLARGERHGMSKLTEAAVLTIRRSTDRSRGWSVRLAARFGVSKDTITLVASGKIWVHTAP